MTNSPNQNAQPSPRESVVLIVEDQRSYSLSLKRALRRECDLATIEVTDFFRAVQELERRLEIVAVVADEDLGHGPTGMMLLDKVGREWPRVGRLLLSGLMTGDMHTRARVAGYEAYDKSEPWPTIVEAICELAKRCQTCHQPRGECICDLPRA
jgi:DNA-binding NtrC family response regulator